MSGKKNKKVAISEKPTVKVGTTKPTRKDDVFSNKITLNKLATDEKRKDRYEHVRALWYFDQTFTPPEAPKVNPKDLTTKNGPAIMQAHNENYLNELRHFNDQQKALMKVVKATPSSTIIAYKNVKSKDSSGKEVTKKVKNYAGPVTQVGQYKILTTHIPLSEKEITQKFNPKAYFPYVPDHFLKRVRVTVYGHNGKGDGPGKTSPWYTFLKPKPPKISAISFNENGKASATITVDSTGQHHKTDVSYWISRQDNMNKAYKTDTVCKAPASNKTDKFSTSIDIADWASVTYTSWIDINFHARSRGVCGQSSITTKTYTIAYPPQAVIKKVKVVEDKLQVWDSTQKKFVPLPKGQHNGTVIFNVDYGTTQKHHPVDSVTLQRLKTQAGTLEEVAEIVSGWDSLYTENSKVEAMQDLLSDAYPETGIHVWYRLVTVHGPLTRIGAPVEAKALYHGPSAVSFIDVRTMDNEIVPTGIRVLYGYKKDQATGTQIEWSENPDALYSNKPPTTYDFNLVVSEEDAKELLNKFKIPKSKWRDYEVVSKFFIRDGLTDGLSYYISACRYSESGDADGGRVLGPRTWWVDRDSGKKKAVFFGMKPRNVVLWAPTAVKEGKDYTISWGFDSDYDQTAYTLYYMKDGETQTVLRSRTVTTSMTTTIKNSEIKKIMYKKRVVLRVEVETQGLTATSDNAITLVQNPPDLKISMKNVFDKRPVSMSYQATQDGLILLTVYSSGYDYDVIPGVELYQADGDVVYTTVLDVKAGSSTYDFPSEIDLYDTASYTVEAVLVSKATKQRSSVRTVSFSMNLAHKASPPSSNSSIQVDSKNKTVTITPYKPTSGYVEGDLCDIYRITPDGPYAIQLGVPFGKKVRDSYAPFSKTALTRYMLVTRTADGSTAPLEKTYRLLGYMIRFDWGKNRVLEVPYNLRMKDAMTKDVEVKHHLDGTVTAHWNEGVDRKGTLNTDLIRLQDPLQKELVRELSRYAGSVFVRTPDGCAYEADVQVTNMQNDYDSLVLPVTFSTQEVDLGSDFIGVVL